MDSINIYRGIASFLIAIWGTFAWMPDSKTKNNTEHVRNSVLVDFASIAPSTTIFMLPTESDPSILPIPLVSFWENMAQCETLNNWKHKGKNEGKKEYLKGLEKRKENEVKKIKGKRNRKDRRTALLIFLSH